MNKKILGIGNAIVDVLAKVSDEFNKVFAIALEDNEKGLIEAVIL